MSDRAKIIEAMAAAICGPGTTCEACRNSAERALLALQAKGLAVVPVETAETLSEHIGALLRILEDSPPQSDADVKRVLQIATAFGERCWAEASKETER
jgi:predicted Fe-Mo cluster-binding NifX family protein